MKAHGQSHEQRNKELEFFLFAYKKKCTMLKEADWLTLLHLTKKVVNGAIIPPNVNPAVDNPRAKFLRAKKLVFKV